MISPCRVFNKTVFSFPHHPPPLQAVRQVTWHGKGDYLASVMPDNSNLQVLIHQISKRRSQNPFSKNKGLVQCVSFHPIRPYFFVATQRYVRVYNLIKQELTKKLMANCKWISSMAIHPAGEFFWSLELIVCHHNIFKYSSVSGLFCYLCLSVYDTIVLLRQSLAGVLDLAIGKFYCTPVLMRARWQRA